MSLNATDIKRRLATLKNERSTYEVHCQEIVDYLLPFRQSIITKDVPGQNKMTKIFDSTGTHALLLFAAGMASRMANKSIKWFKIGVGGIQKGIDEIASVKQWLEYVEEIYYTIFDKSNFYIADQEAYIDDGAFGHSNIYIAEHPDWLVYFETLNLAECYVATNQYGQIDTMYRKFELSARNVKAKWGDKASPGVQKYIETGSPDKLVQIVHAVEPRTDREPGKKDNRNMSWTSVYMEFETDHILNEGGYKEFPYCVSRYFVPAGEIYGRGPGMIALPDIKELQQKKRDILKAGQKKLSPPLLLPNDGFLGPIRLTPSGINFTHSEGVMSDKIGVFPVAQDLMYEEQDLEATRNRIGRIFFNDIMLLAQDKEMTATEFIQIAQEKMQMLGPYLGRVVSERYNPLFDRVFNILWDVGVIPPPPEELIRAGGELKIDYISPLAKAQKSHDIQGILQVAGFIGQVAAIYPEAPDVVNWDEAIRKVAEDIGLPQSILYSPEIVAKIKQARQQQMQEQQQAQMMLEGAKAMPALAKGPEPGSPMEAIGQMLQQGAGNA